MKEQKYQQISRICLVVLLTAYCQLNVAGAEDRWLPVVTLGILEHTIIAEVADTASKRSTGLMHRTYLPEDSGMLFIFPTTGIHCMWMKDTVLPLSVAFLDEAKKIVNIAEMIPETLIPHCSVRAARYALEMNTGWFAARKIKVGDRLTGAINSDNMQ
ncbi:DUF192 domain-containing protein [Nitrosomonas sp. HPC101]|uniref:DUF192 domain-containing protein n=1 Tax=Nitrosomonas sp. HPC101 TaxID=1658667 RepID=UPI00136E2B4C|nr:DUF192 domain-containing protein [Nitrosomonas sp. HPC101]MXS85394.1 DUF192 domain-containing protein [Nitrosomonas sp. HPC101]